MVYCNINDGSLYSWRFVGSNDKMGGVDWFNSSATQWTHQTICRTDVGHFPHYNPLLYISNIDTLSIME